MVMQTRSTKKRQALRLFSSFTDDLLNEILIRLPDSKTIARCGLVCRRWWELIHSQHFKRIVTHHHIHQRHLLPHSLLIKLYKDNSLIQTTKNTSHNILYKNLKIESTFDDLLLIKGETDGFYISNPLTHQSFKLPKPPHLFMLRTIYTCGLVLYPLLDRFRVVLLTIASVTVYCSETGQWTMREDIAKTLPEINQRETFQNISVRRVIDEPPVAVNGRLYWTLFGMVRGVRGVVSFDPLNIKFRFIKLPYVIGSNNYDIDQFLQLSVSSARIGVVNGRLRLARSYPLANMSIYTVLKVWELVNDDDINEVVNWVLVYDVKVKGDVNSHLSMDNYRIIGLCPNLEGDEFIFLGSSSRTASRFALYHYKIGRIGFQQHHHKIFPYDFDFKFRYKLPYVFAPIHLPIPTKIPMLPSV
ncbi:hypothetical protein G4B88_020735 [Cannabis sativa]|uniref:F-box protein At3g26010-like beta-propeller domain-containing protein n=1 Tax=Cannabis sativa TaxID=3483 RepID=A0A7J6HN49_CANSA|nr:hypothetical protein G4B88_020735 [Cannabis sativa]